MRIGWVLSGIAAMAIAVPSLAALTDKKPPYFASIAAKVALMRTGPGRNFPASWKYQRPGLPIKILENYKEKGSGAVWRKVSDPGGTEGWMQSTLLGEQRTAIIMGDISELRDSPRFAGKVNWRAEPGVVGRVSKCVRGWCYFDVMGRGGFVEVSHLWGVDPAETLE